MPSKEELDTCKAELYDTLQKTGMSTAEHYATTWYWLKHLFNAADCSDLVGWENIQIAKFLNVEGIN